LDKGRSFSLSKDYISVKEGVTFKLLFTWGIYYESWHSPFFRRKIFK